MSAAKFVRFAAVLVVLAGYGLVFRGEEGRIGERAAENARLVEQLGADERTLAARGALDAERARLRARLHAAEFGAQRSALVARFVRDAARIAAVRRTTIPAIAASGAQPAAAAVTPAVGAQADAAGSFDPIPLEITVEGHYADVLATIGALSAARVPATVDVASLARKNADSADTTLTAALHVVLQRLAPAGSPDVRARPF